MEADAAEEIQERLIFSTDIQLATQDTDLVLDAVADNVDVKKAALKQLDGLTPDHCMFVSYSSYIVS